MNNKNIVQKIYECKKQTYNYVIYLLWFVNDIEIEELSKPENFNC